MTDEPEIVETDTLPAGDIGMDMERAQRNAEAIDELHGARDEAALDKAIRDHIVNDFEAALNLIVKYQKVVDRLQSVDPHWDEARPLLNKYGFTPHKPNESMRVFDPESGRDVTYHADSIPSTVEEEPSLPEHVKEQIEYYKNNSQAIAEFAQRRDEPIESEEEEEELTPEEAEKLEAALRERIAERMAEDGYEPCPICEGEGVATKGVMKGRKCSRCGGNGFWKPPERAELVSDEEGNVRLRPVQKGTQTHPDGAGRPIPEDD